MNIQKIIAWLLFLHLIPLIFIFFSWLCETAFPIIKGGNIYVNALLFGYLIDIAMIVICFIFLYIEDKI